jgi:uncharacterized protein YbbK (DUF523 family)
MMDRKKGIPMPRPPAELRRMNDEERRRARAHRRLKRERRLRAALWLGAGLVLAAAAVSLVRLIGFPVG